jgi:hypothetical protein
MINNLKLKIEKAKIETDPFPHFVIKNFLDKTTVKKLNKILPDYKDVENKDVIFQSSSETKKTIMPDSKVFKDLLKIRLFKKVNDNLKKIKPIVLRKFKNHILENVNEEFINSKIKFKMNFALMRSGYLKSAHLDRRDHLISGIYYPTSMANKGGNLMLCKLKKKHKIFDIFPAKNDLRVEKNYKINDNFIVFFINVPWAYHAVSKYNGSKDRKYFYIDYDFNSKISAGTTKNRKKGMNNNKYWKSSVDIKSLTRKKTFFKE